MRKQVGRDCRNSLSAYIFGEFREVREGVDYLFAIVAIILNPWFLLIRLRLAVFYFGSGLNSNATLRVGDPIVLPRCLPLLDGSMDRRTERLILADWRSSVGTNEDR